MRTLAKTAHAFAVAELGLHGFSPTLIDIIKGTDPYLQRFIGCVSMDEPQQAVALSLQTLAAEDSNYVSVNISMHSFPQSPQYQVLAGRLQ